MAKPPKSTPDSDINGVHQDEARNTDVATEQGESAGALQEAREESVARPDYIDKKNLEDRSR